MSNFRAPSRKWIETAAKEHHLDLTDGEIEFVQSYIEAATGFYEELDKLHDPFEEIQPDRQTESYVPTSTEDPYNAFVRKCKISRSESGPLAGLTVGVKDAIGVAGMPATAGSLFLENFVPRTDAPVVTRLLDAGATILGKTNQTPLSYFDLSAGETSAIGPVRNPRAEERTPGGSSSGSAVAVIADEVDVALGTDQGGSIRSPASLCGCVGMKPTWGLVPYVGVISFEDTIDHVGPMARTARHCAQALDAMAGMHPHDHRQNTLDPGEVGGYEAGLEDEVEDLTIGILTEAMDSNAVDGAVREEVLDAIHRYEDLGATVTDVSVPKAEYGKAIWSIVAYEGIAQKMSANGLPYFTNGITDTHEVAQIGMARKTRSDVLPAPLKASIILGEHIQQTRHGRTYAKAQALARELRDEYEAVFDSDIDILAMPTTPTVAADISDGPSFSKGLSKVTDAIEQTTVLSQFNLTGHPALSVPCGSVNGLPVGLQLVGGLYDDGLILSAAHAYQERTDAPYVAPVS